MAESAALLVDKVLPHEPMSPCANGCSACRFLSGFCLPAKRKSWARRWVLSTARSQKRGRILFSLFLLPGLPSWFPVPKLNCEGLFDFRFKPFSAGWQPLACSMVPYARDTPSGVDAVMSQCTCSPDEAQRNPGKTLNRLPRIPSCQDCIRATSIP
jgi:hypothetical protein